METRQDQPAEGRLIEEARKRLRLSQNAAAKLAGMSGTRWRQIVYGQASGGPGIKNPVRGNAVTLAAMAEAVELRPDDLRQAGRDDAAHELEMRKARGLALGATAMEVAIRSAKEGSDGELRRLLELWPRTEEWQRRMVVGVLEQALNESPTMPTGTRKPEQEDERRAM